MANWTLEQARALDSLSEYVSGRYTVPDEAGRNLVRTALAGIDDMMQAGISVPAAQEVLRSAVSRVVHVRHEHSAGSTVLPRMTTSEGDALGETLLHTPDEPITVQMWLAALSRWELAELVGWLAQQGYRRVSRHKLMLVAVEAWRRGE